MDSLDGKCQGFELLPAQTFKCALQHVITDVDESRHCLFRLVCLVHRENQDQLGELVEIVRSLARVRGMDFTFYVPEYGEVSAMAWDSVEEREAAVDVVCDLKERYPDFIWNSRRSLELMRPRAAKIVTQNCPANEFALPLFLEGDHFTSPLCCLGNAPDCDRCGSWGLFYFAAKTEGPWDEIVPPVRRCGQ